MWSRRKKNVEGVQVLPPPFHRGMTDWGQLDIRDQPTLLPAYGFVWGGVQLSNGWQTTNMGRRDGSAPASIYANLVTITGDRTRQMGQQQSDFVMQGMSPVTVGLLQQQTAGMTPQYTGGVGTVSGSVVNTHGAGG